MSEVHRLFFLNAREFPGRLPSVTLLQVAPTSPRIAAREELARGLVRYGEITFTMHHLLAWQDNITAGQGWSVVCGEVTPGAERQVKPQLLVYF